MNINEYVYIHPTMDGLEIINHNKLYFESLSNGWYKVQLWKFMNIFGDYMWIGNPRTYFYKNEILFVDPTK